MICYNLQLESSVLWANAELYIHFDYNLKKVS